MNDSTIKLRDNSPPAPSSEDCPVRIVLTIQPPDSKGFRRIEIESNLGTHPTNEVLKHIVTLFPYLHEQEADAGSLRSS